MKRFVIILAIFILLLCLNKQSKIEIPKESIRFRIIANSNTSNDQAVKQEVVKNLTKELKRISISNDISTARVNIIHELPNIRKVVQNTLDNNNFNVAYGKNYFPEKKYKGVLYESGEYESLVITIGEGSGKNFWCVLFPPLCLIDETESDYQYTSLIKEIVNKYFN